MQGEAIYKGATRPAMKLGIPLVPLVVLFGTGMLLLVWGGTLVSWWIALGVVVAFRRGALVSVDLMLRVSRGGWRRLVRAVITLASLAFLAVLLWFGIDLAWRVRFQTFASMELSMAWAYAALPVGAGLAILALIAQHIDPMNEELENAQ